jgi:hypothetical protein
LRCCWRQVSTTVNIVSMKRLPSLRERPTRCCVPDALDVVCYVGCLRASPRPVGARSLALDRLSPPMPQLLDPLVAPVTHGQQSLIAWVKLSTVRHGLQVVRNVRQLRASFQFAYDAKRMHSFVRPCEPGPPVVISSCRCRCPVVFSIGAIAHATAAVTNQSAATGLGTRAGACKGHGLIVARTCARGRRRWPTWAVGGPVGRMVQP